MNKENVTNSGVCEQVSMRSFSQNNFTESQIEEAVHQLISVTIREFCESGSNGCWVKQNEYKCMETSQDGGLKLD